MELEQQLGERQVTFDLTEAARVWMSEEGYDDRFGARPMTRVIQDHIKKPLADEILFGRLEKGGRVTVDVEADGKSLCFRFPDRELPAPKEESNNSSDDDIGDEKEKEYVKV